MTMKRNIISSLVLASAAYAAQGAPAAVQDPSLASSAPAAASLTASEETQAQSNIDAAISEPEKKIVGLFGDINVGTQGVGFNLGYEFNSTYKLRFRGAWLGYNRNDRWDDMNVHTKVQGSNFGVLLDVHPFGGSFHVSAGLNIAPISVDMNGKMDGFNTEQYVGKIYTFGGYDYKVEKGQGWVRGEYKWHSLQPYIGIGWSSDGSGESGLYFSCDLGINIMGSGSFSVSSSSNVKQRPTGTYKWEDLNGDMLKNSIKEEGKDFFKIADKLYVYPVLQIGVGYRF